MKTVGDKGIDEVYDATAKSSDVKRFCTLNLIAPLKQMADGSNTPPPHIVFHASGFRKSDDWDKSEVAEYHPGVVVSFQKKAWVDAETHKHGLTLMMAKQNERLEISGKKGVVIEDNLLSHNTNEVMAFWGEELRSFIEPQFVPPNMTENVQVVDRHCGVQYKEYAYRCVRREYNKRLKAKRCQWRSC